MENKDKRTGWLRELKEGDKVVIKSRYSESIGSIGIVSKITPTGRINANNIQFDSLGCEISSDHWGLCHLYQWNQEAEDNIMKQKKFRTMCAFLHETDFSKLPYEIIEEIYNKVNSLKV